MGWIYPTKHVVSFSREPEYEKGRVNTQPVDLFKLKWLWYFCCSFQKVNGSPIDECIFYFHE